MDFDPPPPQDLFNLQESRRERTTRRARSRRNLVIGGFVAIVVLAAAGYGTYALLSRDHTGTALTTTSIATGGSTTSTTPASSTTSGSTGTTLTNLAPTMLDITANPEVVKLAITLQDGSTLTGKTPFAEKVPGGKIRVELSKAGYNTTTRELTLDKSASLKVWLDPEGQLYQSVVRFKCGPSPAQVAFSPDGRELWVALLSSGGLEVYDPETGAKTGGVDLEGHSAVELIFTRDGNTVYASQMQPALVHEIDRVSRSVKRTFETGGSSPKTLLLSPDETTLWVANWGSDDISEIDLATGKTVRRMPTVKQPRGLYATPDGKKLYVGGYGTGELQRIDLASGSGTVVFKTTGALWHMAGDGTNNLLYMDDVTANAVYVVDLVSEKVGRLTGTDQRPSTLALSPNGAVLYVANRGRNNSESSKLPGPEWGSVLAIDTTSGRVLDAIVGGNQCTGLALSSDGTLLAFSDFLDDHVRVYSVPAYETLAAGDGGRADRHLADIVKD